MNLRGVVPTGVIAGVFLPMALLAAVTCENGVCRLLPDDPPTVTHAAVAPAAPAARVPAPDRIAEGVMSEREFLAFLSGTGNADDLAGKGIGLVLLLAVLGGLAINLTPCVLPMVPVNLIVIGASLRRGMLYGLGQFLAFGALGLAAAFGGAAFGTIQSSPWFNLSVAAIFLLLALTLTGVWTLDFSRLRRRGRTDAFLLGAVSAVLAGACVAPVLASVLLFAARLAAEGSPLGFALPFAVAFGLALPWPFLGAGLRVLPKPGVWMKWVNRVFAVFVLGLAVHYLTLAVGAWRARPSETPDDLSPAAFSRDARLTGPRTRPLLVFCHADWCRNCPTMEKLLTDSPAVRKALEGTDVVRLKVIRPDDLAVLPGLAGIRGLPAFALYRPR